MEEPRIVLPGATWSDRRWLLLLVAFTLTIRAAQVCNTELTTRDSIAYIRGAWRLDQEPWAKAVSTEAHHPGYAFTVWLASKPVRYFVRDNEPYAWQLSAQVAAAAASLLLVVPMFYLGKELFDSRVGFWSALLFQVLPSSGRLMADGLSEPLFLLLVSAALLCVVRALGCRAAPESAPSRLDLTRLDYLTFAGVLTGLAYLTRTEGLLVVLATLAVLAALQLSRWARPWRTLGRDGLALVLGCAVIAGPFMALIGGFSLKDSYKNMTNPEGWKQPHAAPRAHLATAPLPLADWNIGSDINPEDRNGWAARTLVVMIDKGFFHFLTLPAFLGVWLFRRRPLDVPGLWVLLLAGVVLLGLLWKLGQSSGYIGERHVMLIVLGSMYYAVATVGVVGGWLARGRHARLSLVVLLALVAVCLPKTLARLHGNRSGFRAAGEWLAANTNPGDDVFDPLAWTGYHAGRLFVPENAKRSRPSVCYVVIERSDNDHPHLYYLMDLANALAKRGKEVHRLPIKRGKKTADIVIYRVPRPPKSDTLGQELNLWLAVNLRRPPA